VTEQRTCHEDAEEVAYLHCQLESDDDGGDGDDDSDDDASTPCMANQTVLCPANEDYRYVRYSYLPTEADVAQIALKANDLMHIIEVTESGWAAGFRVCQKTLAGVGEVGWFPAGYLCAASASAA